MRFCSNLRFAELLFASAFGAKRVGTVSESTEKWDGNSAYVLAPAEATHQPIDRSVPVAAETRREQEGNGTRRLRTAPLAVTRRRKNPPTDRDSRRKAEDKIARGSGGAPHDVTFWEGV